jgi:hypothetical protein
MIRFDDNKLGEVLRDMKYYRSGIRSDYGTLAIDVEEMYHGKVIDKLLALREADLEFTNYKHLENTIFDNFKKAFGNAVEMSKAEKRRFISVDITTFIESPRDLEGDALVVPEALQFEDVDLSKRDEIDYRLESVRDLLTISEYDYLDFRLNGQRSVAEVMTIMHYSRTQVANILRDIKRKCAHLRTEGSKYTFTPYGDYDMRNTLELFSLSEYSRNQYVNYVSTNKLAIHIEESDLLASKGGIY